MTVLTMTRIIEDVDTVALIGYSEAENRREFIRDYCRETYGNVAPQVHGAVARAFREVAEQNQIDTSPRMSSRHDYRNIGTMTLF